MLLEPRRLRHKAHKNTTQAKGATGEVDWLSDSVGMAGGHAFPLRVVADDDSMCVDCRGLVAQRAVLRCECGVPLCALCRGGPWWCQVFQHDRGPHGEGAGAGDVLRMSLAAWGEYPSVRHGRGDRLTVHPGCWGRSALRGSRMPLQRPRATGAPLVTPGGREPRAGSKDGTVPGRDGTTPQPQHHPHRNRCLTSR